MRNHSDRSDRCGSLPTEPQLYYLKQVTINDAEEANRTFDILMGKEVAPRKLFIQTHAKSTQDLDI